MDVYRNVAIRTARLIMLTIRSKPCIPGFPTLNSLEQRLDHKETLLQRQAVRQIARLQWYYLRVPTEALSTWKRYLIISFLCSYTALHRSRVKNMKSKSRRREGTLTPLLPVADFLQPLPSEDTNSHSIAYEQICQTLVTHCHQVPSAKAYKPHGSTNSVKK